MRHPWQILTLALIVGEFAAVARADDLAIDPTGAGGAFKTVQAAIDAAPVGTAKNRTRILIKPGTYTEQLKVAQEKRFLSMIGMGAKPEDVVLTFNLSAKSGKPGGGPAVGTGGSSSTIVSASDFVAENLTFANSTPPKIAQAVAIRPQADRMAFNKCRFIGFQDTLYPCVGRQFYHDCYITGTVDFIFGDATAVFDKCTINSSDRGYITAASTPEKSKFGFVFLDCNLTASDAAAKQPQCVYLGRPWRPYSAVVYIRCKMGPHIYDKGWDNWRDPANEKTARYAEFGSLNQDGKLLDVSMRVGWSRQLTAEQGKEYTIGGVLSGADKWNPVEGFTAGGQEPAKKADNSTQEKPPAKLEVTATKPDANGKQKVTATVTIEPDFFIFANEPGDESSAPLKTNMAITGQKQLKVKITYPKGEPFEEKGELSHLLVYRRKVIVEAEVDRAIGESGPLEVVLRVAPFDDKRYVCYPPISLKAKVP